ncbi:MAG: primosomal protein N' [Bacteroidales bacterium]|nr:primosomal protein N' [Bacteroidales bacterium]
MNADDVFFADVLLPLHVQGTFTYRIPREFAGQVKVGARVVVQFGRSRLYSAVVRRVHQEQPSFQLKYVLAILDTSPIVNPRSMDFWEWMADYYMCTVGDVMAAALPAALKLASESAVSIHPDFEGELSSLSKTEMQIVQLLTEHRVMKVNDVSRALNLQKIMPVMKGLIERQVVIMDEELRQRYTPRTVAYVSLAQEYATEEAQAALFAALEKRKSTAQVALMMSFLQLSHFGSEAVAKADLRPSTSLDALVKRGVFHIEERVESRITTAGNGAEAKVADIVLNDEQQAAFDTLRKGPAVSLLHGVTSSGKTEVYIKLIDEVVSAGKQALFLVPEIALTSQLINRLRTYFGDKVGVYHSRFSNSQRAEVWHRTHSDGADRYQVLLGARSAIFLPFVDLALVIIDEEHDASYKQTDPLPRYNGRDAAIYLASMWKARTVLGSATPSIECRYHALTGKYGLAEMKHRYGGFALPEVECVDMKEKLRTKQVKGIFSDTLISAIETALDNGQQAIIFQNRRGFAPRLECDECHHVPQCVNCDVSLVYHKGTNTLRCHRCGYSIPVPSECPQCHSTHLRTMGIGTERIEEDLHLLFPNANVARMDLDSTSQKNRYDELLTDFQHKRIDILVGTQMVTKGLDFEHVSVVGIIGADSMINFPDFRAYERAFQQMTQVSGRAGRHGTAGRVIIQTFNPFHMVLDDVRHNNYDHLYGEQINERRVFHYPPFSRLIEITLKHRSSAVLDNAALQLATTLKATFGTRVIGPEYPLVTRVRGLCLKMITMRFERTEPIAEAKKIIMRATDALTAQKDYASVAVHFDVDPY